MESSLHTETEPSDRRSYELTVLRDVAQAINAHLDLTSLLDETLQKVAGLLGLDTGWVLLLDASTGSPYAAATHNLPPGLRSEPERMTGWCYCTDRFVQGKHPGAANVGVVKCSRLHKLTMAKGRTAGLRFHASIPLEVRSERDDGSGATVRRLGILNVASTEWREITEDELDILRTIGGLLGVAIERAQLHEQRLEAAQTRERLRLAREIHDTIAQDLSAIAFHLDTAELLVEQKADLPTVVEHFTSARMLANKGLQDVRRSVLDLRDDPLEGRTLQQALAGLADPMQSPGNSAIDFDAPSQIEPLPEGVETAVYRIAQEAVQNATRHAAADRISVQVVVEAGEIRLSIEDDGEGFDPENTLSSTRKRGRFGLIGMRERARFVGGTLQIESSLGVGTRIEACIPISEATRP